MKKDSRDPGEGLLNELDALLGAGGVEAGAGDWGTAPEAGGIGWVDAGSAPGGSVAVAESAPREEDAVGAAPGQTAAGVPGPQAEAPAHSGRILVIEDSKDYSEIVQYLLAERGYHVMAAKDGTQGLRLALKTLPDLILLDFNMPGLNGYEVIQELRSNFDTRRTPIVMFTGAPNRRHLKELGMSISAFLEKPVSNATLLATVTKLLPLPQRPKPPAPGPEQAPAPAPEAAPAAAAAPEAKAEEALLPPIGSGEDPAPAGAGSPLEEESFPAAAGETPQDDALEDDGVLIDIEKEVKPPEEDHGLEAMANDSPLVRRVNMILVRAVEMEASDIHIEPQEKQIDVRVRVNGSLKHLCSLPAVLASRLAARIKIMSDLVITQRRLPQDGQFRAAINGRKVEFRVSTMPGTLGEKIVMRILGSSKIKGSLAELGFTERDLQCVERSMQTQNGLILVTGPTGSGKTTTLYSMLHMVNKPDVNVMTAEDPVEYRLPGITQVHVKSGIGLTFETVLRSFLRQDPDIMLVGEIRDLETAEIAVKASITGHLVLSTLHTNSAPQTVTRLTQMGLAPFLVGASLRLVVAQRLIKVLCPACKVRAPLSSEEKRLLTPQEIERMGELYRAMGCAECHQTGFTGRRPVFEVMPVRSPEMRQAILQGGNADTITAQAVREGMVSLREAAMQAVAAGQTSLPEALKIILAE